MTKWLLLLISLSLLTISGCKPNRQLPARDRSSDIAGPDLDGNGIRDDVDAYINSLDLTEPQRKGVRQLARSTQSSMMTNIASDTDLQLARKNNFRAINCLGGLIEDSIFFVRLSRSIESITANTKERAKKYDQYNLAQSGSVSRMPKGNTCDE